jgi:glycosyltransferase involved in cell wall biosynthesis
LKKLAIVSSHPIQYNAPLFALLAKEPSIDLMVFYTWGEQAIGPKYDPDFKKTIEWDIPLLEGYAYTFIENTSSNPGSHHFRGIINPSLNQEMESWGAQVIWVWGWAFHSHLKAIRHFNGKVPVWFRGDSTLLDESKGFSIKKYARRLFLCWVYKHIDKAFYVGTHNKAYYKTHGVKETELVYAPHAIDNDRFVDHTGEYERNAHNWRAELGFTAEDFVLLFAGKLETKKNPFFLVELAHRIENKKVKFLVVGNGELEADMKLKTKNESRFVFLDFQNQSKMPILYRMANLFVLPSSGPNETWGLALNEALACGIPILASDKCGGAIDLINTSNGFVLHSPTNYDETVQFFNLCTEFKKDSIQKEHISVFNYNRIIEKVKKLI